MKIVDLSVLNSRAYILSASICVVDMIILTGDIISVHAATCIHPHISISNIKIYLTPDESYLDLSRIDRRDAGRPGPQTCIYPNIQYQGRFVSM